MLSSAHHLLSSILLYLLHISLLPHCTLCSCSASSLLPLLNHPLNNSFCIESHLFSFFSPIEGTSLRAGVPGRTCFTPVLYFSICFLPFLCSQELLLLFSSRRLHARLQCSHVWSAAKRHVCLFPHFWPFVSIFFPISCSSRTPTAQAYICSTVAFLSTYEQKPNVTLQHLFTPPDLAMIWSFTMNELQHSCSELILDWQKNWKASVFLVGWA